MRKPISVLSWVVLAIALVMLPAPARAGWGYSAVDVFGTTVVGTSTTYLESWEFYEGYHPYVEGTLRREWQTLGSNYQYEAYWSYVSVQVYASVEPGNAMYWMDGDHSAGMDVWNLYYVGSSQGGYYYFDPAAWPPYIYGISPNVGVSGVPGYIPIYGAYLAPQGTTPQVSMDGATLWIMYQSDNQINVYYDYVSLGTHDLRVTTIYGQSNAVQFTALAGDPTPSISTISPEEWEAGVTTDFSIAGTGFGTNPGLTITGGWIDSYGVYSAWDTGMNAWVTVSPNAPDETVTVTVTSNGYWGNSFMAQYPNQPQTGSKNAQVKAAAPPACPHPASEVSVRGYWCSSCVGGVFTASLKDAGGATPPNGKYQGRTVRERLSDLVDTCFFDDAEWRAVLPNEGDWGDWPVGSINGYGSDLIGWDAVVSAYYRDEVRGGRYSSCSISIKQKMEIQACDGSGWAEYHSHDTRNTITSSEMTATRGDDQPVSEMSGPIGD